MGLAPGTHPDGTLSGAGGIAAWGNSSSDDFKAGLVGKVDASTGGIKWFGSRTNAAVNAVPQLTDGQSALEGRTDLLDGARGYCHLIQAKNWSCPANQAARRLPFERQVGPSKGAYAINNGIRLSEPGLWRADALVCWQNTTMNGLTGTPNWCYTATVLAVHKPSNNSLFTRKHFYKTVVGTVDPESVQLSHEFVIPEDGPYDVAVWVGQSGPRSQHYLYGGIQYSGLWVTKIDSRVENVQPNESVGDGGPLT